MAGSPFVPISQDDCLTQNSLSIICLQNGLLTTTVAGSLEKLTCHNKSISSIWLVAGDQSQPCDHIRGEEGQQGVAMSTSTHTQPDSLQRTCRANSSLHVWPQSQSLHLLLHAMSCQISCPWTPWSSLLHSERDSVEKKDQSTNMILFNREWCDAMFFWAKASSQTS